MCPTNAGIEDTEHFFLLCPCFDLKDKTSSLESMHYYDHLDTYINDALLQFLLYGDDDSANSLNRHILELTLKFIRETGRFE